MQMCSRSEGAMRLHCDRNKRTQMHDDCPWGNFLHEKKEYEEFKMPLHRISSALFAMFFSHVATATLLHHKTKITRRSATPALKNIGARGLR